MKNKKYEKYKNIRKNIIAGASGGIMAGMLIVGSSTAYAETADLSVPAYTQDAASTGMHLMHRWNSPTKVNSLAVGLGLDPEKVKEELKSGKTLKQILQENGIVPAQIQKAITTNRKSHMKRMFRDKNYSDGTSWQ